MGQTQNTGNRRPNREQIIPVANGYENILDQVEQNRLTPIQRLFSPPRVTPFTEVQAEHNGGYNLSQTAIPTEARNLNNPLLTPILDAFVYGPIVPVNSIQNLQENEEAIFRYPKAKPTRQNGK